MTYKIKKKEWYSHKLVTVKSWKRLCQKIFQICVKKIKNYIDIKKNICYIWKVLWENRHDLWKLSKTSTLRQLGWNEK